MDSKKDRSRNEPVQPAARARPQAGSSKPETAPQPQPSESPDDAVPGREYQGSGIANKAGRFGSSKRPEDLVGGAGTKKR
jgi:hypothetical protein